MEAYSTQNTHPAITTMAFKLVVLFAVLAAANAGYLGGISSYGLGYSGYNSYASPWAYSGGLSSGHISSYSSPIISKTISPLSYSSPLSHYSLPHSYSSPLISKSIYSAPIISKSIYSAPIISKTISTPLITKSYAAPALSYSSPLSYSSHFASPLSLSAHSYAAPSYGYASNYGW